MASSALRNRRSHRRETAAHPLSDSRHGHRVGQALGRARWSSMSRAQASLSDRRAARARRLIRQRAARERWIVDARRIYPKTTQTGLPRRAALESVRRMK